MNVEDVDKVVTLVRSEFIPRGRFTADDVYCHASEPGDLDMYVALNILVRKGELVDVNDAHGVTSAVLTHDDMVYETPKEGA